MFENLGIGHFPLKKHLVLQTVALLLILVGVGLRFNELGSLVLHDEVFTLARANGFQHQEIINGVYNGQVQTPTELLRFQRPAPGRGFGDAWRAIKEHSEHSPLYYVLATLAAEAMPGSPLLAVRGVSMLLSLLLFPAIFWLVLEWSGERRSAWIAVALAAASPMHLLFAQQAREYALLSVLIVAASAILHYALRQRHWRAWAAYGVTLTLGLYTHVLFIHVVIAHTLYLTWAAWRQPNLVPWRSIRNAATAVGIAVLTFSPWLFIMHHRADNLVSFTKWMWLTQINKEDLINTWFGHLTRIFVNLPRLKPWWTLSAIIFILIAWRGLHRATPTVGWFLTCLILPTLCMVALPDLLFGGILSTGERYLLPSLIGFELAVACAIAQDLNSENVWTRRFAAWGLGTLLLLGLASEFVVNRSNNVWNKSFSADNVASARIINATQHPLVISSPNEIGAGELISISYHLTSNVRLLTLTTELNNQAIDIPPGYTDWFLLLPSEQIKAHLTAKGYQLQRLRKTWKWFIASALPNPTDPIQTVPAITKLTPLLRDDFNTSQIDNNIWHIPTWYGNEDGTHIERTQFRCTQNSPPPQIKEGNVLITTESYNPTGFSFYGTDLISNQIFAVGSGLSIKARAKINPPVLAGTIGGIFLYALKPNSNSLHDEIDFEFFGNRPNEVSTNIYSNEPLGNGHPEFFSYVNGAMTDYHTYEIQWFADKVAWLVDGKLLRTNIGHVPSGPMALHLNAWVPDQTWAEMYSDTIQPTTSPDPSPIFTMNVDSVLVEVIK